ncbi:hypothetical protein F5J12DRAFT_62920 [Pisolithus orientalis]|uniref:uncharacterized protein n=1 Tax=Pisolithus orientalis TaxID=936130 RepID=UPI0022248AC8|nr:uncharacterized protein F5J12DRAFT_62920 [Pisolithus orientalis]KAI5984919.1 hypothetical protein F5J12DRAFT_62920 [Pisolithus orientalis]
MNMHQPIGIKPHHKSANKQKKDGASRFFSDMFGLKHLRNYIGEIMFFRSLPMVTKSKVSADTMEEDRLPARPPKLSCTNWVMTRTLFKGSSQSNATQDQCLESVLPLLRRRCQILCAKDDAPHRYANEKPKLEHELKSIRQTLSALLLEDIRITFYDAYCEHQPFTGATTVHVLNAVCRQLDIPSTVEEIEVLQMKLDMTFDDDEQRALEEDITGKILWLCWCGICAEVDQLLPKIVDHIRREGYMMGLSEISNIIYCAEIEPDDDQVHLQRIMLDAGAGTSKHQLWLAARAAEEAKWSSTTRDTPTINNNGSTPDTSTQTLSQPIA